MRHAAAKAEKRRGHRPALPRFLRPLSLATSRLSAFSTPDILALAHPDWLYQTVTVTGDPGQLADFEQKAAGAGVTPWIYDYDRMEEGWFLLMAAPLVGKRSVLIAVACILARQLRDMVWEQHEEAVSRVGASKACPFDLHALALVPFPILRLGPDDPKATAWMWEH